MRHFLQKIHFALAVVLFVILFIFSYLVASQFHKRFNWKPAEPSSISTETKQLLTQLTYPVSVRAFFSVDDARHSSVKGLLEEFKKAKSDFSFLMIDPDQHPKEAAKYKIDSYGVLVVEGNKKKIRSSGIREGDIALSLSKIAKIKEPVIYFVKGHREASLYDRGENGYSEFLKRLKMGLYKVNDCEVSKADIPNDANLVVIAGPHADFEEAELKRLGNYVSRGGSLLVMVDPVLPGEGEKLRAFLAKSGIGLGADAVVDGIGKELTGDYLTAAGVDLTDPQAFYGLEAPVLMPLARSVKKSPLNLPKIKTTEILRTADRAWAETNLDELAAGKTVFDEALDYPGPIPLVVISESEGDKPGKIIALGDSEFLNNAHFHLGSNEAFMMKLIELLLSEHFDTKEKPVESNLTPFALTPKREAVFFGVNVIGIPALLVITGIVFYLKRKKCT